MALVNTSNEVDRIFTFLNRYMEQQRSKENSEEAVENIMTAYITDTKKDAESLAASCFDPIGQNEKYWAILETILDVDVSTIVNIYCSKGMNFEPVNFKSSMKELGFAVLACSKLYTW